jgi:methylmalonyl-CoA mutase N-terminal domain/subunit
MENKEDIIVGVNEFQQDEPQEMEILKVSEETTREQIERLKAFKSRRNSELVKSHLKNLSEAAQQGDNLMPQFVAAVKDGVTLGEISDALRKVFGVYKETITL